LLIRMEKQLPAISFTTTIFLFGKNSPTLCDCALLFGFQTGNRKFQNRFWQIFKMKVVRLSAVTVKLRNWFISILRIKIRLVIILTQEMITGSVKQLLIN